MVDRKPEGTHIQITRNSKKVKQSNKLLDQFMNTKGTSNITNKQKM